MAAATVGITSALAALAETGSVVLASGPGRGRLASLLPLVHVAVVRRTDLIDSLAALVAREPGLFLTESVDIVTRMAGSEEYRQDVWRREVTLAQEFTE